ncbi:MAG: SLBB domain-containing protein [Syntrophothermus sp.]
MRKVILILITIFTAMLNGQENTKSNSTSSQTLMTASAISVTVGGSFIVNGTYPASPFERVDLFVTRLFNMAKLQKLSGLTDRYSIEVLTNKLDNVARRNIKLKRSSGETLTLDLEKFRLTGDFNQNPYLRNEDVLIFPPVDIDRDYITIDGAVNASVKFQYVEGDKLSDALMFAQGVSKAYENVSKAEINRLSYSGSKLDEIVVDINADFKLQPGDRIRILADETNRKDYRVLILGEVNMPGYIPISRDNTTVRDLIKKAGGFRSTASLRNAEVIRGTDAYSLYKKDILTKSFEQNRLNNGVMEANLFENIKMEDLLMTRMSYLTEEDTVYFKIDNALRQIRGNELVDFTKLDNDSSASSKFILKDGDVVLVPEKKEMVYIFGQVANAGYVKYNEGKDVSYYIREAGGLGELARDVEEISVIKARSRSWSTIGSAKAVIEPGDYIWVPKKTPRTFSFYLQRVGAIASVVGTVATIILLGFQFKK